MSVFFVPSEGLTIDLGSEIQAIREENHKAVSRKTATYITPTALAGKL